MGAHLSLPFFLFNKSTKMGAEAHQVQQEEKHGSGRAGTRIILPVTPSLDGLEKILGYKFKDQNLLQEAYIHASVYYSDKSSGSSYEHLHKSGPSYERLEYMGDSVLNVLVAKQLFVDYPELSPGPLTKLRAANVDNEKLARVAIKLGLHRFLTHKHYHLVDQVRDFSEGMKKYPIHSNGLIDPPKFLADIVESTIGAIYVDSNYSLDTVWKVFKKLLEPIITPNTIGKHPYTELKELCNKNGVVSRFKQGSCNIEKTTTIEVYIDDVLLGSTTFATGSIKKEIAQNRAAKKVLDKINQSTHPFNSKERAQNRAAKKALDKHKQSLLLATDDDDTVKDSTSMVITPHQ